MAAQMPIQIGSYVIERLLQATSYYENYRGFDPQKKIPVFIKRLAEQALKSDLQARESFSKQVRLLRTLNHPHICHFIQAGMEAGRPYLVCEYIEGVTLRDFLIHQMPRPIEALYILRQIGSALSYLHKHQIIHNDLKPENILISVHLKATLIDFSISQSLESAQDRKIQQLAGTLLYMSPEQQTLKKLSAASDLYSFAIIAYELITGRLSHGIMQLAFLPQALQIIFAKALQNDPTHRYKSAEDFLFAIECAKESIAGMHLRARKNHEQKALIDFYDLYVPFHSNEYGSILGHSIFIPSTSFDGTKEIISTRIKADSWLLLFIDSPELDREWLYYLKAIVDQASPQANIEEIGLQIEAFVQKFSLHETFNGTLIEIGDTLEFKAYQFGHSLLFWQCKLEDGSFEEHYLASSGPLKESQGTLKPQTRLIMSSLHQMSPLQVASLLQSASLLSQDNLTTFCNLACYRLSEQCSKVQKMIQSEKMTIPTLKRSCALLGIQLRTQNK